MLLFKCSCGCLFTVKNCELKSDKKFTCQNCGTAFTYSHQMEHVHLAKEVSDSRIEISAIPDNAKFNVTFEI